MKNLHLLPTEKPSILGRFIDTNNLFLRASNDIPRGENVNIYITSDEEIKEGDVVKIPCGVGKVKELFWKFGNDNPSYIVEDIFIYKLRYGQKEGELQINSFRYEDVKKIILTTDQDLINDGVQAINDEVLEWFIKNPNCREIEVVDVRSLGVYGSYYPYKIIIPKEDTKQETLYEAAERLYPTTINSFTDSGFDTSETERLIFKNGAKWQQEQNKKLYSEEDLLNFGAFVRIEDKKEKRLFLIQDYFKKWFEQYKKK